MSQLADDIQKNPTKVITTLQAANGDDLTKYLADNLQVVVSAKQFLSLHGGGDNDEFMRGVVIGLAFGMAGASQRETREYVARDLKALIGVLTSKDINILTGRKLNEEITDSGTPASDV